MKTLTKKHQIVLGADSNGMAITPAEFDGVEDYDENYQYELIHGVLVVYAYPDAMEAGANDLLGYYLIHYQQTHPAGASLDGTMPQQYVRTPGCRRIADRLIWTGLGRMPNRNKDVPTVAVEFVSQRQRDRVRDYVEKRQEYGQAGIKEYWIIDRFQRTLTVFQYKGRGSKEVVVAEQATYSPACLPGFELPLARILEAADRLAAAEQPARRRAR